MPAPTITTIIPDIENLPSTADGVEDFDTKAIEVFPQLNAATALINQAFGEFNAAAVAVFENADVVVSARDAVLAAVNFRGPWAGLTGALAVPASVIHANGFWVLLENLADVTAEEPGSSTKWARVVAEAESVLFNGALYSMAATNVQAALGELSVVQKHNPILNGDMRIAQSGTSFAVTTGLHHLIDGWLYGGSHSASLTIAQESSPVPGNANAKWLTATVTASDTSIASDDFAFISQKIEGYEIEEYLGKTFTLGFEVKSSVTGVHCVCFRSASHDAAYIAEINILAANTPQFVAITVPGGIPALGTWNYTNGVGLEVLFMMVAGSNFHGSVNGWNTLADIASSSQSNVLATVGNSFGITEVRINPGIVAAKFQRPTYSESLARCQRYYEESHYTMLDEALNDGLGSLGHMGHYKVSKRVSPALTPSVLGFLGGGDSITVPSFSGTTESYRQSSVGVWNAFAGQYRETVTLKIVADARLI